MSPVTSTHALMPISGNAHLWLSVRIWNTTRIEFPMLRPKVARRELRRRGSRPPRIGTTLLETPRIIRMNPTVNACGNRRKHGAPG